MDQHQLHLHLASAPRPTSSFLSILRLLLVGDGGGGGEVEVRRCRGRAQYRPEAGEAELSAVAVEPQSGRRPGPANTRPLCCSHYHQLTDVIIMIVTSDGTESVNLNITIYRPASHRE